MVFSNKTGLKFFAANVAMILILCFSFGKVIASETYNLGLQVQPKQGYGIPLFPKQLSRGLSLLDFTQPVARKIPRTIKRDVKIDSIGTEVEINETTFDLPLHLPANYPLKEYTRYCLHKNKAIIWQTFKIKEITGERVKQRGSGGIEIAIPVKIKSRAFQTIFGGDQVSLTVTGQINIRGGFRHEKRSQVKTAINRGSDYNFKMEQQQQFRVKGNIGDKVTVSVDQDSERPFDFENTVKLNYKGYDDEILQSIQAGNISLSLPGTRFVSFSGKNSGLFGIKAEAQIGNFHLTTIASQEKGENKTLNISGGAEEDEYTIKDYNYMRGVYFFLDKSYRENYTQYDNGSHIYVQDKIITALEIYKSGPGYEQKQGRIYGWAVEDANNADTSHVNQENTYGYWIRLDRSEYFLETALGFIRLRNAVSDDEMLAIAYRDSSGKEVGKVVFDAQIDSVIMLKMLKPKSPRPADSTWDLMFRHVYYLGGRNIDPDGFEVKIYFDPPSGNDQETVQTAQGPKSWLNVFGLDDVDQNGDNNPDNIIDNNSNFLRLGQGELEFPSLRPFADENNPLLPGDKYVEAMYDTTNQSYIANESKFFVEVKSKNRSANYDLGWNVIEGSEEVTLNDARLIKDKDYIIDYYSGKLTVLREEASSPSANVEVNYQRNEMFQLEKKTLLGMRGEYKFWDKSFIGGTFLYLNQSTMDQKVRVGKGPMRNLIWDVNTSLSFEPNFLTKAIDAFPIIETKAPSKLNFEGEIAQILPNPNTLNNNNTGDNNGVAYIDDFEAAKKITPLGVIKSGWRPSSSPLGIGLIPDPPSFSETLKIYKKRGHLIWYNPYEQVAISEIWPNRDTHNPNTPQRVHVLTMEFDPAEVTDDPTYEKTQSWNGIQRWLSAGYADQTDSKFLEVWVNGSQGNLHIDLGQISEDIIPNGRLNTEDIADNGIRNNLLDAGEDVGLDGMTGADPEDYWDINNDGEQNPGEPNSYDDWNYTTGGYDYSLINGTEGNENDPGGRYPDSEDFNGNGSLDMQNNFFRATFSLAKNHADTSWIAGGQENEFGWRMYRIPLNLFEAIGVPDWSRIEYARVWIDSCDAFTRLRIAEINLVGNDWKEMGVAPDEITPFDPKNDTTVVAAVTNTHDNDDYVAPPGVSGVKDRITRVEAKEQALIVRINELEPGASGILRKTFFQAENYIHYDNMKMFIHGGDTYGTGFTQDKTSIELFLRFGSDDNNYYEYRAPVFEGWEGNNMEIPLNKMAMLKLQPPDTLTGLRVDSLGDGRTYQIKGEPSLTNVRQFILGVKNISNSEATENHIDTYQRPFNGEIWVNELRLSGVKKDKGIALRARAQLQVADVFSINGEINKKDADFHNVNQRFGSGNNEIGVTFSGNFSLHKFLPRSWGLSIPINFNYSRRKSTPKYLPGSDILVTSEMPDSEMVKIQNVSENKGFGVSFKKNTRSNNFFIKHSIDRISLSFNTAESRSTSSTHKYSDRTTYTANVNYSLAFPKDKYLEPFKWLAKTPLMKKLAEIKFFYLPSSFSVKASGNRSNSKAETRSGVITDNETFRISRSFQTGINPFKSLKFDFSRNYKNDLRNSEKPLEELSNFKFGQLTDMNQMFKTTYNPQLARWLKTNVTYSTNFKFSNNLQLKDRGRNASNNTSLNTSLTFDPDNLVKSLFKKSSSTRGRSTRGRRPASNRNKRTEEKPEQEKKEKGKQKDKKKSSFSPKKILGSGIGFFTSRIKPLTINIRKSNNVSNYGLNPLGGMPSFDYMMGMSNNPGMESVEGVGTNTGSLRFTNSISLQSGLKIIKQMDVSLKYNRDNNKNETTTITGDESESWFYMEGDSGKSGIPIPEWSVRWSGLEKIGFLKKFIQRLSLDHNFSGKRQQSWQNNPNNPTKLSYNKAFRPMAGLNMTLKKNITVNLRYNWSESVNMTVQGGSGGQKSVQSDLSLTASWSHSGGLRIPLPFLKNKELKNTMDLQLTVSMNNNQSFQNLRGQDWVETDMRESWSIEPQLTYSFSRNVRGGMHFKLGKNRNKRVGDTSLQELGINVNIAIRGS
ncbi:cell surface protein SprA [candidate division KSB1 bacterium]|nr:cell surface protein SprA [candidate division KSB1 bacterium]